MRRYINYSDLYKDVYSCNNGPCYARKFLEIDRAPIVVVYPDAPAARAQAQAALRADMVNGVKAMGAYMKERVNSGAAGLPSISSIGSLMDRAIAEIDSIDQPVNESMDQRLRRLGLGSATRTMARYVRDS